ncbi:DUF6712 family protein [Sphingobacterium spiritivorum]|uniref:DUF6712 family protein n=1 Tax=Sphingobacterium spiritivorum TaxID=258 RepID=UPI003DA2423E
MKLITHLSEVSKYISVNKSFDLARLEPHIDRVERGHIIKLIGNDTFNRFADAYNDAVQQVNDLPAGEKDKAIKEGKIYQFMPEALQVPAVYLQDALCNIAFMSCLSQMQTTMGEAGIRLAVNENQKTAFQWQIDDMKYQMASDGFNALNDLLLHMEDNAADFPEWKNSESYFEQKKYFVESAELFSNSYFINSSRMTFLTMRYIMQRIEQFDVKRIITPAIYNRLKDHQLTGYNPIEKILMNNFIMPGIVLLTVAKGIVERAIEVTDLGVQTNLYTYFANLKESSRRNPLASSRDQMIQQLQEDGNEFLKEARNFLESNPEEFGEIPDSDNPSAFRINNKPERKIFGM